MLYSTLLYSTVLYCTILYYTVLYCTILFEEGSRCHLRKPVLVPLVAQTVVDSLHLKEVGLRG